MNKEIGSLSMLIIVVVVLTVICVFISNTEIRVEIKHRPAKAHDGKEIEK
jgi:energy-converting hydrogenase Eha subunit H